MPIKKSQVKKTVAEKTPVEKKIAKPVAVDPQKSVIFPVV